MVKNIINMFIPDMFNTFKFIVFFDIDEIFVSRIGDRNFH